MKLTKKVIKEAIEEALKENYVDMYSYRSAMKLLKNRVNYEDEDEALKIVERYVEELENELANATADW